MNGIQRHPWIIPWAIAATTFFIYLPAVITNDFVTLDDTLLITRNAAAHGLTWENIRTAFTTYDPELYVPLTLLTYQIEYSIAGLIPWVFHLTNLLLHIGSTLLVFFIIQRITNNESWPTVNGQRPTANACLPAFTALLFALHPLNTEAVVWAAARKDVLSGFLVLGSLLSFLKFRDEGTAHWYWVSIATFGLALLAKVSVLLLPAALLLLDILKERNARRWKEYLPFGGLTVIFGTIALFGKTSQVRELALVDHALIAAKAIGFSVTKFVLPTNLTVYQPQLTPVALGSLEFLIPIAIVALLGGIAVAGRKKQPLLTFGLAFFLVAVAPSFVNVWKNGILYFASDRYAYIGGIGLGLGLGTILLPRIREFPRNALTIIAVFLTVTLGTLSFVQSRTWRDSTALYTRALLIHPTFAPAESNLGSSLYESGDREAAMAHYDQALILDPSLTPAHVNIGILKQKSGDQNGALAAFRRSVEVIPEDRALLPEEIAAYSFLGSLLDELGHTEEALAAYRTAANRAPDNADAHYNLAVTLQKYRQHPEAREHFLAYLRLRPRDLEARYRLSGIEAEMGLLEEAEENLEKIVDRDPQFEQAAKHLENIRRLFGEKE